MLLKIYDCENKMVRCFWIFNKRFGNDSIEKKTLIA